MLYLYYAFLKEKLIILITINSIGFVIESAYLTIFMIYATKESRAFTTKLLVVFNVLSLAMIVGCTYSFVREKSRPKIVGWICAVFSVSVFAAPLSIMRQVIKTKSVEFMPFSLSFFLTICSVVWFFYGFLISDYYIAAPNILGFAFGLMQMGLYFVYKNKNAIKQHNQPSNESYETKVHDIISVELKSSLDKKLDNGLENESKKLDLEIVVLDCEEQVAGIAVIQSH
ncbi:bidirectional sugar transporter NEC1 [Striga asiatica]|uniref:Bidirectional sugar transporter NEC1 n=1 Tax=Striga asiatica TaxID=4170 RepID=A0A5A7NWU4_STRAF|nr:bidirectional sugar transporter NEC1 [Striga asiatica]